MERLRDKNIWCFRKQTENQTSDIIFKSTNGGNDNFWTLYKFVVAGDLALIN